MAVVKPGEGGTVDPVAVLSAWDDMTFPPHVNTQHSASY
jgi:hypothetical protein